MVASKETPSVAGQVAGAITARAEATLREGRTELHLRLEPPELGTVRIHLTATDQGISTRLVVHEEMARQLIESQMQHLRQRLMEAGVPLGQFDVTRDGGSHGWDGRHSSGAAFVRAEAGGLQPRGEPDRSGPFRDAPCAGPGRIDVLV